MRVQFKLRQSGSRCKHKIAPLIGALHNPYSRFSLQDAHARGDGVLVHCSEGRSRSVTLVLAYLMTVKRWPLKQAFDHVK